MMSLIIKMFLLSGLFFCLGCSDETVSRNQYKSTLSNLECYDLIQSSIANNADLASYLLKIRDSKDGGRHDPTTVRPEYRTLDLPELLSFLTQYIDTSCLIRFDEESDFRGLRLVDNDMMILEVDRFTRHTLSTYFSSYKTIEFHRIVYCSIKPKLQYYGYGKEVEVLYEQIDRSCFYQVTQLYATTGIFK